MIDSCRAKKDVGAGVSSGRVKKSPIKGSDFARSMEEKVNARLGSGNAEDVIEVFVKGGGKWEDDEYMGEV
jgi:hypothetical protein